MRSALICFIFWLTVQKHRSTVTAIDEFYPTPIPLNEWHPEEWKGRAVAGTLHETIYTAAPPSVVAVPAHYWEDALRHSVYLTLVRDKIDQLIAKDVISYDKISHSTNKDIDDHNLWDKIKHAPFDRIESEDPGNLGEVTVISKGKMYENNGGFRFAEDEKNIVRCSEDKCMDGVKALWSVKRVRQRDVETSLGKYHYELTFSVITPKRQRKPYENPARTFTVREMAPKTLGNPHEYKNVDIEPIQSHLPKKLEVLPFQAPRQGRALWFHKNVVPTQVHHQARRYQLRGTERLFSSLFMDDDYDVQRRHPHSHPPPPPHPHYSKVGYGGSPSDSQQQKKYTPYAYKPHTSMKYPKPPMPFPPVPHQHHYLDIDAIGVVSSPYIPQPPDNRYHGPSKPLKPTRPAVLPTPVNFPPSNNDNVTSNAINSTAVANTSYHSTKFIESKPIRNKPKPGPIKISYFTDNVRPPVYNAPPGVFVTMDKKPFKPMPPLKLHLPTKYSKPSRPLDFRPSPQLLDIQFSEPDPLFDGAFRPITVNYASKNSTNVTESTIADSTKTIEKVVQKIVDDKENQKKPTKKKSQRITTSTTTTTTTSVPSTVKSTDNDYDISWGNLLGVFSKTTPMGLQQEKTKVLESILTTTVSLSTSTTTEIPTTSEERKDEVSTSTIASTTPVKRTRPPPKFKYNKLRKHKRVSTTKEPPTVSAKARKPVSDLVPHASTAARPALRWTPSSTSTTTPITTTSTTIAPTTTFANRPTISTEKVEVIHKPSKSKNRYRQTTLMQKGTSVNHDKWSLATNIEKVLSRTVIPPTGQFPPRKTDSKFNGYTKPSTQQSFTDDFTDDEYEDYVLPTMSAHQKIEANTEPAIVSENAGLVMDQLNIQELKAQELISLYPTSTKPYTIETNEKDKEQELSTLQPVIELSTFGPKNKTKCKKKKLNTTTDSSVSSTEYESRSTENAVTHDIFEDLLGAFTYDESNDTLLNNSTNDYDAQIDPSDDNDEFIKADDFSTLFLNSYEREDTFNNSDSINDDDLYSEDDDEDDDDFHDAELDESNEKESKQDINGYEQIRPYSIFELLAME